MIIFFTSENQEAKNILLFSIRRPREVQNSVESKLYIDAKKIMLVIYTFNFSFYLFSEFWI